MINTRPGQALTVLWYFTGGPQTKPVTVKRLTPRQVITIDEAGEEERFWRATSQQVGGASHLMTREAAEHTVKTWHTRNAQRISAHLGRPFLTPNRG